MDISHSKNIIRSLYVSFFSTLAIIVLITALYAASQYSQNWIVHTNEVKAEILSVSETLLLAESKQRGYILTRDPEYRIDYKVAIAALLPKIEGLVTKISDNESQKENLKNYRALVERRIEIMNNNIENYVVGTAAQNINYAGRDAVKKLIATIDDLRDQMLVEENELLLERKSTYDTIYIISLIALALAVALMLYNIYTIRQRLLPLFADISKNNETLVELVQSRDEEIALKEAQMEMNEDLIIQMENKNKQLNQFAYIASHDLQEPLRTVDNFIELFEEDYGAQLEGEAATYFTFIKGATKRMKSLITGLLNYSRLGKSGARVNVELEKVLQEITNDFQTIIDEQEAIITHDSLPTVTGYPIELRELFANLISNALKFTPNDRNPKIHIVVRESKLYWTFDVIDNGLGIKEEHLEKVFNMFTRLHSAKEYQGTGIGLAFCYKIVELHKGKISVTSTLGEGSTFTFTIKK